MPIVLYRIDDRLVHGQVVLGWGQPLRIGFIVLVDDAVAGSDWERELYRMGAPPEMELIFSTVAGFAQQADRWRADLRPGLVLTGDVATMAAICRAAPPVLRINLGGIHHKPGRRERLPYVYLSEDELRVLEELERQGTEVIAQDVPGSAVVGLAGLR
jgi:PTS system mannose-specific IIB component/fructoselysine and glucoselysine-specific PTS system IIB component